MDSPLTTTQAAEAIGVSRGRILAMIATGRLRATRFGAAWQVAPADLEALGPRKAGRPRKIKSA